MEERSLWAVMALERIGSAARNFATLAPEHRNAQRAHLLLTSSLRPLLWAITYNLRAEEALEALNAWNMQRGAPTRSAQRPEGYLGSGSKWARLANLLDVVGIRPVDSGEEAAGEALSREWTEWSIALRERASLVTDLAPEPPAPVQEDASSSEDGGENGGENGE